MECIRMIGYDAVHPSDFVYDVSEEHGYYLLILTHTPVRFRDGDGERIYPARHAALFSPDSRIHYSACEETYSNDWIIFSSDEAYVTQFPLQNRPFPVPGPYGVRRNSVRHKWSGPYPVNQRAAGSAASAACPRSCSWFSNASRSFPPILSK